MLSQHLIEGDGLGERARIAVQHKALRRIVQVEALGDHVIDEVVGDELTFFYEGMRAQPGGCLLANGFAENVAGADVFQTVALAEQLGLSSLTASWRTEKNKTHGWPCSATQSALERTGGTFIAVVGRPEPRTPDESLPGLFSEMTIRLARAAAPFNHAPVGQPSRLSRIGETPV